MIVYGYQERAYNLRFNTKEIVEMLKSQGATGFYLIEPHPSDALKLLAAALKGHGLDFILGITADPRNPDPRVFDRAKRITRRLAVGSNPLCEWGMTKWSGNLGHLANLYKKMAKQFDYEWICPFTHESIPYDIKHKSSFRSEIGDTLCMCLCGYVLAGYLYADIRIPHQKGTCVRGMNLHGRYGITIENVAAYLKPLNILSGAGWQPGLKAGSMVYANRLGFKGMVIGIPFDLTGMKDVPVNKKPPSYPISCGNERSGYIVNR